nr:retrovirus-related Pol polyprotein from transposon TNT 1-94 [Tanacetum cinerariifolium]
MSNQALVVRHMTILRLDIFFDFLECDGGSVQLGDNRECKIRGLEEYTIKLQLGKVKVINGSRVILSGIRRDNCVYSLDGHAMAGELNASVEEKDSLAQVWHKRLGYISEAGLQVLEMQGLFGKKSLGSDRLCSFRLMGYQVESLGGKRYFLSIVDDYSRRTGRTVKKLRTDNGLELCNQEFEQLCIESGIGRYLTVAGTPQQNGVAERMNKTLIDKVRCLLIRSGLPKTFYAEATCTAAYRINRSPSRAIEKKTPMKMWSGHPSDYGMLRIFGCVAYSYDKQGKLEPRAERGFQKKSVMYKDTLKDFGASDKSVEELQVEVELQRLNNHTPEKDQTDQEDGDDEDAGDQATDQPPYLTDYQLVRDREPRIKTKPLGFRDESNLAAYAFVVAGEEDNHEPLTYHEATTGYEQGNKVCLLKKSLYGLKQSHKQLYRRFDEYMLSNGFKRGSYDRCVYYKSYTPGVRHEEAREAKKIIVKMPLGGHFKLSLKDCPVRDCDVERMSKVPYANAVGSLMYLMVCTRPDIVYA